MFGEVPLGLMSWFVFLIHSLASSEFDEDLYVRMELLYSEINIKQVFFCIHTIRMTVLEEPSDSFKVNCMMFKDTLIIVDIPNPKFEHGTKKNVSQTSYILLYT